MNILDLEFKSQDLNKIITIRSFFYYLNEQVDDGEDIDE